MPRITTINVQPFDSAQGIDDDVTMAITADFASDIASAVEADHDCEDSTCDIHHALLAGAPIAAACILLGATECAHVDAVACAHKLNGTIDPAWPNPYAVADWPEWKAYHDENGRECGECGAHTYVDSDSCGNCLAALPGAPCEWCGEPETCSADCPDADGAA